MPGSARKRVAATMIVVAIMTVALIVSIVVSSLAWPFGAGALGQSGTNSTVTVHHSLGVLEFNAILSVRYPLTGLGTQNASINAMEIELLQGNPPQVVYRNSTFDGRVWTRFPPGTYTIIQTQNASYNFQQSIQIVGGETTNVTMVALRTVYPSSFYDIYDEVSAGTIGSWQSIFVRVPINQTIVNVGSSVFIESSGTQVSSPATVSDQSVSQGVLSMDLRPKTSLDVNGITDLELSTYSIQISVNMVNAVDG